MKYIWILLTCNIGITLKAQNQLVVTYTEGHIPTSFSVYDGSCNGPSTIISLTLPQGDQFAITNVHVAYSMTAAGGGWMSDQRSKIKCSNTGQEESEVSGVGNTAGTFMYSRNISIANDTFTGGTVLMFEMWTRRTWEGVSGCNTTINRVDNTSWTLTITYSAEISIPKVGVETSNPESTLDVNGKIKIGDDSGLPQAGMIRFNPETQDFEGFNGAVWVSLTQKSISGGWGDQSVNEEQWRFNNTDGAPFDKFGSSVSVSGDYAVIGTPDHTTSGNSMEDIAYIFIRTGNTWSLQATLTASDGNTGDKFGTSVCISNDYAIIGSPNHDSNGNSNQGKAYIFYRTGSTWTEQAILTSSNGAASDFFGQSVSISGEYALAGAPSQGAQNIGRDYTFKRNGTTWTEQAILAPSDGAQDDFFGHSVSLSGDYVVAGSWGHNTNGNNNQGKAYVFKRSGTSWVQQAILIASDGAADDQFGENVNIAGDYIIAGVKLHNTDGQTDKGKAYI